MFAPRLQGESTLFDKILIMIILISVISLIVFSHTSFTPEQTKEECHIQCTKYVNSLTKNLGTAMHNCLLECSKIGY